MKTSTIALYLFLFVACIEYLPGLSAVRYSSQITVENKKKIKSMLSSAISSIRAGQFDQTWALFGSKASFVFDNHILNTHEKFSSKDKFVSTWKLYQGIGGSLTLNCDDVELVKSSPYTIRLEGNIVMEKGPFAQQPIPVTTQWTYAKNYPEKGHVTLATYTIKQIVKS